MAKRPIVPTQSLSADTQKFFDVLNDQSDLAVMLVGASYLDAALASLLQRFLLPGSTTTKLLDPTGRSLERFQHSRRRLLQPRPHLKTSFPRPDAHCGNPQSLRSPPLVARLHEPDITKLCDELAYFDHVAGKQPEPWMIGSSRNRFTLAAVTISSRLLITALGTQPRSPATENILT